MQAKNFRNRNFLLTADSPGPILGNVMHMVTDRPELKSRSMDAVATVVPLSNLLLVLVLITAIAGVQT